MSVFPRKHPHTTSSAARPNSATCRATPDVSLSPTLRQALDAFEPISLAEMARTATLLNRSEIKYVLPQSLLVDVLGKLVLDYRVLAAVEQPLSRYRTLYFDTSSLAMYFRHHAGAASRFKVRAREYVDSQMAFLEVKHRIGGRRLVKKRVPVADIATALTPQTASFLADVCPYPASELQASLCNQYTRITLVSKQRPERVTLDMDMLYSRDDEWAALPGIVVAEVKYEGQLSQSVFGRVMHANQIRSTGFSKYCMGVSLLYPDVKHNRFKAKQRLVARVQGDAHDVC